MIVLYILKIDQREKLDRSSEFSTTLMSTTIYHNPRCSKSRQTLALLKENGIDPTIIEYLNTPPSAKELKTICEKLRLEPTQIIRTKESLFKEMGLSLKDDRTNDEWFEILAANPKLIERPIVVKGNKAVLGRPPENVHDLIGQ